MVEAVQGKTALITGAAGGIGREVARRLAQDGWNLALWDVRAEEVRTVAQELSRNGVRAWSEVVDVSSSPKVARAGKNLKDLGAVVHAAGLLSTSDLEACTDEEWQRVLDANLTSTFYVLRATVPLLRAAGGGRVVLVTSAAALSPATPTGVAYVATKAAVQAMMRQLAHRLTPQGILVNAVLPGFVDTAMPSQGFPPETLAQAVRRLPLGRMAHPREVAAAVAYLLSPEAGYVSGATLAVTGASYIP